VEAGDLFESHTVAEGELRLEPVLTELEEGLKDATMQAKKVEAALRRWRKACSVGHVADLKKHGDAACDALKRLGETLERLAEWRFDDQRYLQEGHWQREIADLLKEKHAIRARIEGRELVCSPTALRARPADRVLTQGKKAVKGIRPSCVAEMLASARHRLQEAKTAELLECLYLAWKARRHPESTLISLKDAYETFCLAPGWKKENSESAFAESVLALHQSTERITRDGRRLQFEFQQGTAKPRDLIIVRDAEGRELRFLGVHFV
jgi:hypothetical protein